MKRFVFLILLLIPYSAISQDFNTVYYNSNWEITSMKDAKYFRNSGFNPYTLKFDSIVVDHFMDGTIEMMGNYNSGKKNGQFIYYYPNQSVKFISNYSDNNRTGIWTSYFDNGQINKVVEYTNGEERLLEYYKENGKNVLKKLSGKYYLTFFLNPNFASFSESPSNDQTDKYNITGKLKNGYKNGLWEIKRYIKTSTRVGEGDWHTNYVPDDKFLLNFKNGTLINSRQYLQNNTLFRFIFNYDTLTYLIPEPEKIQITESLFRETGQKIKQNYVIKAIVDENRKSLKKVVIEDETELKDFFDMNFSRYVTNCSDTLKLKIILVYNDQGNISVESINPHIGSGIEKEVYRVIDMISEVKTRSKSSYLLNFRIRCIEELDYKK